MTDDSREDVLVTNGSSAVDRPFPGDTPRDSGEATPSPPRRNSFQALLRRRRLRDRAGPAAGVPEAAVTAAGSGDPDVDQHPVARLPAPWGGDSPIPPPRTRPPRSSFAPLIAALASTGWVGGWSYHIAGSIGLERLPSLPPQDIAGFVSALVAFPALAWLTAGYVSRGRRLKRSTDEVIRHLSQLHRMGGAPDALLSTLRQGERAVHRQIDLLDQALGKASELSAKLTARLAEQQAAIERSAHTVDQQTERTRDQLSSLAGELTRRVAELGGDTERATQSLNEAGEILERRSRQVSEMGVDATMLLSSVGESFTGQVGSLRDAVREAGSTIDRLVDRVRDAEAVIDRQAGIINAAADRSDALERLVSLLGEANERMAEIGRQVDRHLSALEGGSEQTRRVLAEAGQAVAEGAGTLITLAVRTEEAARTAAGALDGATTSLGERAQSLERLAESTAGRIVSAADTLGRAGGDLESRIGGLDTLAGQTVARLEEASATITGRMETLAAGSDAATKTLAWAVDDLDTRSIRITEVVGQSRALFETLGGQLDIQGAAIADIASEAARHLETVGGKLNSSVVVLQAMADDAAERLENAVRDVDDRARLMEGVGQSITARARDLFDITGKLTDDLRDAGERLDQSGLGLDTAARRAVETLAALVADLPGRLAAIQEGGSQAQSMLRSLTDGSEAAEARVIALRDALADSVTLLQAVAERTGGRLDAPMQAIDDRARALEALVELLAGRLATLDTAIAGRSQELVSATERAVHGLVQAGTVLESRGTAIDAVAEQVAQRFAAVGCLIDTRLETLEAGAERAGRTLTGVGTSFLEQAGSVTEAAQRAQGSISLAGDALDLRRQALAEATEAATRHLKEAEDAVRAGVEAMHALSGQAAGKMDDVAQVIDERGRAVAEAAGIAAARLSALDGELAAAADRASAALAAAGHRFVGCRQDLETAAGQAMHHLNDAEATATARLASLNDAAGQVSARLVELADNANGTEERLGAARSALESAHELLERTVADSHERLVAFTDDLRQRIAAANSALSTLASDGAGPLASAAEALKGRVEEVGTALRTAAEAADTRLTEIGEALMERMAEIGATGDGATNQVTRLAEALAATVRELAEAGEQTEARLVAARESLVRDLEAVSGTVADCGDRIDALGPRFDEQGQGLLDKAQQLEGAARAACDIIQEHAGRLDELTATAQERIGLYGDSLRETGLAVGTAADEAAQSLEEASAVFRRQVDDLGEAVTIATERLDQAIQIVPEQIDRIDEAARLAADRLTATAGALEEPKEVLDDISQAINLLVAESERSVETFRQHTDALNVAAERTRQSLEPQSLESRSLEPAREGEGKGEGDGFLLACGRIIEQLEGLALEIGRQLVTMGNADWTVARKADRAALVRRFADLWDEETSVEVETRHGVDDNFKAAITDYLDSFEALFSQQSRHGMPNVLNSVFLSSDLGRLYMLVARAIGRLKASS